MEIQNNVMKSVKPVQLELFPDLVNRYDEKTVKRKQREWIVEKERFERELARRKSVETKPGYISGRYIKPMTIHRRKYQLDAVEQYIAHRNVAIIADTGTGKTVIAAMIINRFLEENTGKKVLFLTPQVVLSHQQEEKEIRRMMTVRTGIVTGEKTGEKRAKVYHDADVVFGTPQTVVNDIAKGRFDLSTFGLVIFDEAHHGTGNYDYVKLADLCKSLGVQRVLLSASLAPTTEKMTEILETFGITKTHVIPVYSREMTRYSFERMEESWYVMLPEPFITIRNMLKTEVEKTLLYFKENLFIDDETVRRGYLSEEEIKDIKSRIKGVNVRELRRELSRRLYEYRLLKQMWEYIESEGKTIFLSFIDRLLVGTDGETKLLEKVRRINANYLTKCGYDVEFYEDTDQLDEQIEFLINNRDFYKLEKKRWYAFYRMYLANKAILTESQKERLTLVKQIFMTVTDGESKYYSGIPLFSLFREERFIDNLIKLIETDIEHPKLRLLINELKLKGEKDIVFVRYREMAKVIAREVERVTGRKVGVFLGQEKGNTRKRQKEIVERFRNGEFDVLVTTIYEGFNFYADNAYFYDHTATPVVKKQREGRVGRHKNGFVIKLKTRLPDGKVSIDQIRDRIASAREKRMEQIAKDAEAYASKKQMEQTLF